MRYNFLLLAVLAAAPAGAQSAPASYRDLPQAECLLVTEAGTRVFNTSTAWETFWNEHVICRSGSGQPLPPPEVDFTRETLAGVFFGGPFTGCSDRAAAVAGVRSSPRLTVVAVGPLPDLGPCDALVYPLQVIAVPKTQRVRFLYVSPS